MDYKKIKVAHFIGIGGIGISAIARMMLADGVVVSGGDQSASRITRELKALGATIYVGHDAKNIPKNVDIIIYTIAISDDNEELQAARSLGVDIFTYPEILGTISREKFTVAVAGTHGKTTTTAMISTILTKAGKSPTVIVGSLLKESNSNFVVGEHKEGEKDIFVVEACEYKRSFLNLSPDILVITNIDKDHLDYYKDLEDIKDAFLEFITKVKSGGYVVANFSDKNSKDVLEKVKKEEVTIIDYSLEKEVPVMPKALGNHNLENARAALAVSRIFEINKSTAFSALENFSGTWRRFEYKGKTTGGVLVYDDYAHHPTEIKASLTSVRENNPEKNITVIFQPHLYSRTKLLLDDLAESFDDVNKVFLMPVYSARERPEAGVDSTILFEAMKKHGTDVVHFKDIEEIQEYLEENSNDGDVIMTVGAGDVYLLGEQLVGEK